MIAYALISWTLGLLWLFIFIRYFLKRASITAAAVLIVVGIQVFVRPLMFFTGVDTPYPYNEFGAPDWMLISAVLVLAIIWVASFSLAHQASLRPAALFRGVLPNVNNGFSIKMLTLATVFTTCVGAFLTLKLIAQAGNVVNFIYSVKIGKELTGSYVVREISIVGAIFSLLAMVSYAKKCKDKNLRIFTQWLFWFFVALFVVNCGFNYAWGNRSSIAMLVISLLIAWHFHIKRMSFFKLVIVLLVAVTLLQGLKVIRNTAVKEAVGNEMVSTQSFWLDVSTSMHFSQFDAFMLAFRDAGDRFDYRYGKDFLNGLLSWVPRSLYPAKESYHIGGWFRRVYQPSLINGWPVTTIGSWYVNFGLIGIIFGGFFSGFIASIFDANYRSVKDSTWQAVISPVLAFFLFEGGVGTGFVQGGVLYVVPIFLLAFILRVFKGNKRYLTVQ